MRGKNIFFYLGNILIVCSLVGFTYILYPLVTMYLNPPKIEKIEQKKGFFVTIPKISAQSQVISNVDPWNEAVYNEVLKKGVAHAKGTALPGQNGTIFLFAHSSAPPWELTHSNTIFLRLNELEQNDEIVIDYNGEKITFVVSDKKEVWPNEVTFLEDTKTDQLILQTCTPIGTSLKRLLVFAKVK